MAASVIFAAVQLDASPASTPSRNRIDLKCTAICVIKLVFGRYGDQAVRVAGCETGGTFSVWARNGQYLGLFQMGSYARSLYGHSWNAWGQARAAYQYFVDSGRDWSPWSCKPW